MKPNKTLLFIGRGRSLLLGATLLVNFLVEPAANDERCAP